MYGRFDGVLGLSVMTSCGSETAVMLRSGHDFLHYISMDSSGEKGARKNSTICRSSGPFKVEAGDECKVTTDNQENQAGIEMDAVSGDIILRAPQGKIRIHAQDIELIADGYNGRTGYVKIKSNDKIIINSKSVDIRAKETAKFFCENKLDIVGNAIMNIYGGLVDMADGATSILGSKTGPSSAEENAKGFKHTTRTTVPFTVSANQETFDGQGGSTYPEDL